MATTTRNNDTTIIVPIMTATDQTTQILVLVLYSVITVAIISSLAQAFLILYVVSFPLLLVAAMQTCPTFDSFDAKKELKRVLQGYVRLLLTSFCCVLLFALRSYYLFSSPNLACFICFDVVQSESTG